MKKLITIFLIAIPLILFTQTAKIDSLKNVIKDAEGIEKADLLLALANRIQFSDIKAAQDYIDQAFALSEKLNHQEGIADAWNLSAQIAYRKGDFAEALKYYEKALKILEKIDHEKGLSKIYNNMALVYMNIGDFAKAEEYNFKSLEIKKQLDDKNGISYSLSNIGLVYWNQRNYSAAMDYFHQSLKIQNEIGDKNMIANTNNNIALAYMSLNNYEKALEYHLKALSITEEMNNLSSMGSILNNLGVVYAKLAHYDESIQFHFRALKIFQEMEDKPNIASTYNNLGIAQESNKNYDEAMQYHLAALQIRKQLGLESGVINSLSNIGALYELKGDFQQAEKYLKESLELSEKLKNDWEIINVLNNLGRLYLNMNKLADAEKVLLIAHDMLITLESEESNVNNLYSLAELYAGKKDFSKAYEFLMEHITAKDTLISHTNLEQAKELKIKYDLEKKLEENKLLKKDLDLSKMHTRNLALTLIAVFIFLAAVVILFVLRIKNNLRLKLLNNDLKIAKNIAEKHDEHLTLLNKMLRHDLTNNLTVVLSALKLFQYKKDTKLLVDAANKCNNGISLIRNLHKMEMNKSEINILKQVNINQVLEKLKTRFGSTEINHSGNYLVLADDGLESVFQNLIENAVDHGSASKINIDVNEVSKFLEIRVVNNGTKIPEEIKDRIFEEEFSHGEKGRTGMGLHLVERNIIRYGGSIYLEENEDSNVSFILNLKKAEQ